MSDILTTQVLERDDELAMLDALATAAARRDGALALVEGPAGIGKTSLLRAATERARDRGLKVLTATASELDREFPFGVAEQLFGPVIAEADAEQRGRLLAGAAGVAEKVLVPSHGDAGPELSHAVLHGLYDGGTPHAEAARRPGTGPPHAPLRGRPCRSLRLTRRPPGRPGPRRSGILRSRARTSLRACCS